MKKKWFVTAACLAGTLFSMAACGNKKEDKTADGKTELSIAVWAYDANPEFKAMKEGFEKANPDVTIKVVDIEADKYEDKVTTMLASGDKTDVLAIKGVGSYVNYAEKKQLLDLTKDIDSIEEADNFKGNLDGYKLNGKYYALPFRKEIYMLYYNKKLFDNAGIDYPKDLTWDEYEDLAKKLTTKSDDGQTVYGAYHHLWYPIMLCTAASQTDHDLLDPDYGFMKDYFDRWLRMQDNGSTLDYSTIKTGNVTYASQFETEKTAMMPMGSFYLGKLLTQKAAGNTDVDWAVAPLPQINKGENKTYGGPTGFGINVRTEHEKLARKFVDFCAGPEGAKIVAGIGMTPGYQSSEVMDILFNLDGMPQDEVSKQALNPEKNGWEMLPDDTTVGINEIINEEYSLIMVGDETPEKGISTMEKRIKDEVLSED